RFRVRSYSLAPPGCGVCDCGVWDCGVWDCGVCGCAGCREVRVRAVRRGACCVCPPLDRAAGCRVRRGRVVEPDPALGAVAVMPGGGLLSLGVLLLGACAIAAAGISVKTVAAQR